ncbi:hypothetical protein E0H39_33290 [Rhizobium leguminosarum bv. viciae]|uniref:phosphoribosyltransferase-like protein n=1 Tax=Rhizobium leguminosarum TaxID=384 RepID=UPI00103D1525|nr:hypothetical protein [Rhizobium leguminosarum]TBY55695.1 hypothetical protein E0H39_33290 [Rhizobium leguminosarum bv. viciae]
MKLSESELAAEWLSYFKRGDDLIARELLDNFKVVSTSNFRSWISTALQKLGTRATPLALYTEREFPRGQRFFPNLAPGAAMRSVGRSGPKLVEPTRGSSHVGSEGIVAQLLTELARREPKSFLLTPGPDRLRPKKTRPAIHRIAIVTDLIGSGARMNRILDALWKTETFRSWQSHNKSRIQIHVVAYASTIVGAKAVKTHRLKPHLHFKELAPTISDMFHRVTLLHVERVCKFYNPLQGHPGIGPLGYEGTGTLIAFGHGCPNTTPPIFWAGKGGRPALFPNRSAVDFDALFHVNDGIVFADRLAALGQPTLSDPELLSHFDDEASQALLVLSAMARGLRGVSKISVRTGLGVVVAQNLLDVFQRIGWIDSEGAITESGLIELKSARQSIRLRSPLPEDRISVYFPTSLRG